MSSLIPSVYNRAPVNTGIEVRLKALCDLAANTSFELSDVVSASLDALGQLSHPVGTNDRLLLLEMLLVLMSKLAKTDPGDSMALQQAAISLLYKDLPHPPSGYLGLISSPLSVTPISIVQSGANYAFRSADGSYNNVLFPNLGKAGTPYARSVPSSRLLPAFALPDPGLVFDTLLKRDEFVPHPGGVSSLFFAFADLVIHSIFNTNPKDWRINNASSYLDLSILYGNNDAQVDSVRRKDGSGKLWDDVFADSRLLFMPPASCALLVLLNRNHNYIAQRLLDINENRNFVSPPPTDLSKRDKQDEEIFQRARLVNCGYFIRIILGDYVGAILGLVRDRSDWRLDPLMAMRESDHSFVPVGEGNVVSIEFNLLYRWHATLSTQDTAWTAKLFERLLKGQDPAETTVAQFNTIARSAATPSKDVKDWTFDGLERDADGRFKDSDLANILHNATEARAGAYGARGIPAVLRVIEIMGIEQARSWGTCSLNEFRKFLGLKQYSTFEEWNPDPEIHTAAAALYKDIDNLELYVGLQAEESKKPGPGAGLCPGYTISRAILADAVCLTRGDRFLTVDFTPFNFTAWGYQDCQYDPQDGSFGGLLTKLLFRTLPDYYPTGSAYAHFPFLDPTFMKNNLEETDPDLATKYTWTRPRPHARTVPIETFAGVHQVLKGPDFVSAYDKRLFTTVEPILTKEMQGDRSDEEKSLNELDEAKKKLSCFAAMISQTIFSGLDSTTLSTYFFEKTKELIETESFKHVGKSVKYVDIVRDVINHIPVHYVSQELAGLPLKTKANPDGVWFEQETYEMFAAIAQYIYLDADPTNDWRLRETAQKHGMAIVDSIQGHVDGISRLVSLTDMMMPTSHSCHNVIKPVWEAFGQSCSRPELAAQIFAAVVPSAALYSQAVSTVVHYYLREDKKAELGEIIKLGESPAVMAYVYEALRLNPPIAGVYRTATEDVIVGTVTIKAGEQVFASIAKANLDSSASGPDTTKLKFLSGVPEHGLLTSKFFETTVPAILASIFKLKDIELGPGQSGALNDFNEDQNGTQTTQYITTQGLVSPWPDSLIVQYSE